MEKEDKKYSKEVKTLSILSYVGILWIIGLISSSNSKKELKFHVGQGMIVSIIYVIILIINNIIITNLFFTRNELGFVKISGVGLFIMIVLWIIPAIYSILGIINAVKEEEKELPVVGKFAFYK